MYKTYFNKNNTVNVSCSKHVGSLIHDTRYSVVRYDGGSSSPAAPPLRLPPLSVWEICVCEYTVERIKVILWCVWEISSGVRLLLRELSSFKCCPEFEMLYQFKRWLVSVSFTSLVSSRRLIILLNWTTQQLHPIRMQQTSALKQINVSSCREENIVRKHQPLKLCSSDETVTKFGKLGSKKLLTALQLCLCEQVLPPWCRPAWCICSSAVQGCAPGWCEGVGCFRWTASSWPAAASAIHWVQIRLDWRCW